MSNKVVKIIDRQSIMLEDCEVRQFGMQHFIILVICSIICAAILFIGTGITPQATSEQLFMIRWTVISLAGAVPLLLGFGTGLQNKNVPGFRVWVCGNYNSCIYIVKTTSERDQQEVCRAVQELEPKCHEIANKERELERIAQECK